MEEVKMMRWYVVHTHPQAEARALWHLQNQGFCCFLPQVRTLRRHARKVEPVKAPLFPRYLFVAFDLDEASWRSINGTRGVVGLLSDGARPLPVGGGVVETLIEQCDETGAVPLTALGIFTEGVKVRITSGPFTGQIGEVGSISARDRVLVLLSFMGVQTRVQIPPYGIEAA